jgi:maltose alpha-D-glucosyltransferase/alpha-amylase
VKKPCSAADPLWYKDAVIYELHVRAFADSNADGIGDFRGLLSKLDYLQELGVTCLWLLPFFPSPGRDDGYDISDYTNVNPDYGTLDDFREFLAAAHTRNMQVMIELVINHTSDQHPWFQRARTAAPGSPDREMYVWSDTDKKFEGVRIIFTDTEKSNWTWDDVAQQYYWHRFFSHQPDLNFDNPRVLEEVLNAMRFWMDMGVDALRLDAIPYLVERDGTSCENVPETHVIIKHIRAVMDAEYENRLILAEANMWPADVRPYFGDGDECQMAFHFPLMPRIYMALRQEDRLPITDIMAQTPAIPPNCQWGLFLRNHDELTLEMVTDDERDYMNLAYAADARMRINVGIRRRLAPLVDNNRRRIELLNSLLMSFPGTPILYYGDEIGMGDNIYLGDRNGVRTPMQWNADRNAGFSRTVPARLYLPVIMDPVWGYQAINVEAQQSDASSLLHWNRNMIALRKLFQVFGRGTLEFLHPENRKVLAYIRDYDRNDNKDHSADERDAGGSSETVLCAANLSRFAQPVALDLSKFAGRQPVEMLGYVPFPPISEKPGDLYPLTLAPYSFLWLELQPAPAKPIVNASDAEPIQSTPTTTPMDLTTLLQQPDLLESLPPWIAKQRWFGNKSRTIRSVKIAASTTLQLTTQLTQDPQLNRHPGSTAALTLIELTYEDGSSDQYQLPLAIITEDQAATMREQRPNAILTTLTPQATLVDATALPAFQSALLQLIINASADPNLTATRSAALDPSVLINLPSHLSSAEQSNTSILYDETAILKLFRHVRPGENPDVEVARFLTEVAHFPNIPAYLGDLATGDATGVTTLAFLQAFASNQGDGWAWTLDELGRFYESVADAAPSTDIRPHAGPYLEAATLLGRRTAELHLALGTESVNAAFTPEPYDQQSLAEERERIDAQATAALNALQTALQSTTELPAETKSLAEQLLAQRQPLLDRIQSIAGEPELFGQRIRIHGDYHLGQLLRSHDDFLIVDFEGEPARTLEERRRKQSPLRDVAGMLRSFSYAARTGLAQHLQRNPSHADALTRWAAVWETAVSTAFLRGYNEAFAARPELLPQAVQTETLLTALLLEKATYELLYELNNRPTWLAIPLQGILALLPESK